MINYEFLNEMQKQIVNHIDGPVMVLAGAGSGKTRVLTYRIAKMIEDKKALPNQILAITFTNKAANEMKDRLFKMGFDSYTMWVSTFHSISAKILRLEASNLDGYTSKFSIYDEQDKKNVIKKILTKNKLDDKDILDKVLHSISACKQIGMSIDEFMSYNLATQNSKEIAQVMQEYKEQLKLNNAMDFDDLLLNLLFLLKNNELVLNKYQNIFKYILIDEFQDTNITQYEIVKLLALKNRNIFAVGDEDQSIYSWRGANVGNIKQFLKDFEGTLYKLEQNYRSTKSIVEKANQIIKNNTNRIDKTLFTENQTGTKVIYENRRTDIQEAEYVLREIYNLTHEANYEYKDIAILMRMNALSRNFEDQMTTYNIPYRVFGGLKFYERLEIKNILAYLKLLVNPFDEESLLRIINYPKRGIGEGTVEKLRQIAPRKNLLATILELNEQTNASLNKVFSFKILFLDLLEKFDVLKLDELVQYLIKKLDLYNYYSANDDEDINRQHNIMEFESSIKQYVENNPNKTLEDYLESVSLITDIDTYNATDNTVTLATIHSVKGLEFKVVFVVGVEEHIFPIIRMDTTDDELEEERRLMYVAVTRAKERLYLTSATTRYMYGKQSYSQVSRFVKEMNLLPQVQEKSKPENYSRPEIRLSLNDYLSTSKEEKEEKETQDFAVGVQVFHTKFGVGTITELDADTKTAKIDFNAFGIKVLSLEYAPLKILKK